MVEQVYRPRLPRQSPLWQCLSRHFDAFLAGYEERYQSRYGFLRPIIPEVVGKFLYCGDLEQGFARVRCDHCRHEYLLAFSCKGRWFCPSCHQKKVQLLVADGLFTRDGMFHVMPPTALKPLEDLFRSTVFRGQQVLWVVLQQDARPTGQTRRRRGQGRR